MAKLSLGNGFEIDGPRKVPLSQNLKKVSTAEQRRLSCSKWEEVMGSSTGTRGPYSVLCLAHSRYSVGGMNE